jgi:1-acyl-sn-glycerol-3-phosphate acyltransferase
VLYGVAHPVVWWVARWCFSLTVVGRECVPAEGGVIVAANHVSYLDIPILGCALARRADFLAKAELFSHPAVGWFFRRMGGVPIRRGAIDRTALLEVERRLAQGRLVVVYPEGTRSSTGRLQDPRPGVGMLALRTGVPVVPAYVAGTGEAWPPGARWFRCRPISVWFGRPMRFPAAPPGEEGDEGRSRYARVARDIMEQIASLQRDAQARRGEPAAQGNHPSRHQD